MMWTEECRLIVNKDRVHEDRYKTEIGTMTVEMSSITSEVNVLRARLNNYPEASGVFIQENAQMIRERADLKIALDGSEKQLAAA